jgi:glycosyltransferase involved in cell wall biosynthesis
MSRLIFLNRFYAPDHSATSQLLSDLASHLVTLGNDVHVITSQQLYDHPGAKLPVSEDISGVHVRRIPSTQFGRSGLFGRGFDYLSFYASMWRAALALTGKDDVLIAKTDPPLTSVPAMRIARRRGAKLVNWLQDLYPEVAAELFPRFKGPLSRGIARIRDRSLTSAAANVVVGEHMAQRLLAVNVAGRRIHVIQNWCDDEEIHPISRDDNPLIRQWQLEDKFIVGYSGNLGRAHEFSTVLDAAEQLAADARVVFLMIGGGHKMGQLVQAAAARGLSGSFRFLPYQDHKLLKFSLAVPDMHWISLRPDLEGLIVPSKAYGIAAAGKPILAITSREGELGELVRRFDCGRVVQPGDATGLAQVIGELASRPQDVARMGERAREMLDGHFSRRLALERWSVLLNQLR